MSQRTCGAGAVGRDVPAVEFRDGADVARRPIHAAQRARPDGEDQIAGAAEESLVHDELVVAVLVEALEAGAVAAHAMHARSGIAGELDPLRLERMKLRMDDGARKRNQRPEPAVDAAGDQAALRALLDRGGEPFAIGGKRTLAELRAYRRRRCAAPPGVLRSIAQISPPRTKKISAPSGWMAGENGWMAAPRVSCRDVSAGKSGSRIIAARPSGKR